jgi:hypothetical protein
MKTIIFKSEKNAKVYQVISSKAQGVYSQGEVIRTVKTDNIEKLSTDSQYQVIYKELN